MLATNRGTMNTSRRYDLGRSGLVMLVALGAQFLCTIPPVRPFAYYFPFSRISHPISLPHREAFLTNNPCGSKICSASVGADLDQQEEEVTMQSLSEILVSLQSDLQDTLLESSSSSSSSSDNSRNLTLDETVRETLLSTRLSNLNLNRTRVAKSTIPGAGRGLFATQYIAKGDIVTCYPGDALLYASPYDEGYGEFAEYGDSDEQEEDMVEESVIWGSHVDEADVWEEDAVFDGVVLHEDTGEQSRPLTDYAVAVCDTYSVIGMPNLDSDPAYYGHFANDAAGHFATREADASVRVEEGIAAYVLESVELSNAMHRNLDGCHMVTVATRDIAEGGEIFVTYGPDYWMEHASV